MVLGATGGALITWVVRSIGKNASFPRRLETLEGRHDRTDEAIRVLLTVTNHQTAGIRAIVEANRAAMNGTYDRVIRHMDEAEKEAQDFMTTGIGGAK